MLIVLNHKMNLTYQDVLDYEKKLNDRNYKDTVVVCPSSAYLPIFQGNNYKLGSQDVSAYEKGSHTGDIASSQLKSLNVSYCLVGHSERRKYYKECNKIINQKIKNLLAEDITSILCIGETKEERNDNKLKEVLIKDIAECFQDLKKENIENIVIAYEPIWSIGTGVVPTNQDIEEVVSFIKKYIKNHYQVDIKVLYGGSINESNYNTFKTITSLDGFLIGGFSLKVEELKELL